MSGESAISVASVSPGKKTYSREVDPRAKGTHPISFYEPVRSVLNVARERWCSKANVSHIAVEELMCPELGRWLMFAPVYAYTGYPPNHPPKSETPSSLLNVLVDRCHAGDVGDDVWDSLTLVQEVLCQRMESLYPDSTTPRVLKQANVVAGQIVTWAVMMERHPKGIALPSLKENPSFWSVVQNTYVLCWEAEFDMFGKLERKKGEGTATLADGKKIVLPVFKKLHNIWMGDAFEGKACNVCLAAAPLRVAKGKNVFRTVVVPYNKKLSHYVANEYLEDGKAPGSRILSEKLMEQEKQWQAFLKTRFSESAAQLNLEKQRRKSYDFGFEL